MTQQQMIQLADDVQMTYEKYWDLYQDMPFLECTVCLRQNVKFEGHVGDEHYDFLLRLHNQRVENIGESRRCVCKKDVNQ